MFNDIAYLCKEQIRLDEYMNETVELVEREVFVQPKSIGLREFYQAATTDFHPEIALKMADYYDYQDEKVVRYEGKYFDVIRTYRKGTGLELTLQERIARKGAEA